MRRAIMGMLCGPAAVGFICGCSLRALLVILALSAAVSVASLFILGMCRVAGEADDNAGIPRG